MQTLTFATVSGDDKVPGIYQRNRYGVGVQNAGDNPRLCVVTGNVLTTGVTLTGDSSVVPCYDADSADTMCGAGSEANLMVIEALASGASVIVAPVLEAAAAVAATMTFTWTNLGTGNGQITVLMGDETLSFVVDSASKDNTATNFLAAAAAKPRLFCTLTKGITPNFTVTATVKSKGLRGNQWYVKKDMSLAPTGCDMTIAGGTATSSGLVPFSGGTGQDDASNVITLLKSAAYFRIAAAQADAVNAARWEAHVDAEADPLIEHLEQVIFGANGTLAAATSIAQTTLNAYLCELIWAKYCRKHPSQLAAREAAIRCATESTNPWTRADGFFNDPAAFLWGTVPMQLLDVPTHSELKTALNSGITPVSMWNSDLRIVRRVQSHSLNGSNPDFRCLDTKDVSVPQRVREEFGALSSAFCQENVGVGPDLPDGEPSPSGVGTPKIFAGVARTLFKDLESRLWIEKVDQDPPKPFWNDSAKRIETVAPCHVRPHNHQMLNSIDQTA